MNALFVLWKGIQFLLFLCLTNFFFLNRTRLGHACRSVPGVYCIRHGHGTPNEVPMLHRGQHIMETWLEHNCPKNFKKKRQKNINTLDLHVLLVVSHSISIPTIWNSKISLDQSSLAFLQVHQQSLSSSFGSRSSKSWKGWISCLLCCSLVLLHKLIDNFFLPPTYIHNCLSIMYMITHME